MKKTGITTDCVCDLPEEYLEVNDVGVMYFYITTSTGRFRDGYEIDCANLIEYLENGGEKAETNAPEPKEYREFFENQLQLYDEIIHISITDKLSMSYRNALKAAEDMGEDGKRVHVVDSEHLSTGMGHMVINAVEMRDRGSSVQEILDDTQRLKDCISTSFIARNADHLYRNGKVSKAVRDICNTFMLHPVLTLKKGRMTIKSIQIGQYDKAVKSYIGQELRHNNKIDKRRLFITHAGCTVKKINEVRAEVNRLCSFEEVLVTKASATISSNCGEGTLGVLFIKK